MKCLEITTNIGCPVKCTNCPQDVLLEAYGGGKKMLSFEDFKLVLQTVPKDVRIDFSGFSEPFLNPEAVDMVLYADEEGYSIAVFTTGLGLSLEDVKRLREIKYDTFELHIKDKHGLSNIPQSEVLQKAILRIQRNFHNSVTGSHSTVKLASRAGNNLNVKAPKHEGTVVCSRGVPRWVMLPNLDCYLCCMDYNLTTHIGNIGAEEWEDLLEYSTNLYSPLCYTCEAACQD